MKNPTQQKASDRLGVTLLELVVVAAIVTILATIATGVYSQQSRRAKIAATQDLINQLQMAVTRYEVDLGEYPPSGSTEIFPLGSDYSTRHDGSGLLLLALIHGIRDTTTTAPLSTLWHGPYLSVQNSRVKIGTDRSNVRGNYDFLDAFETPLYYVRSSDYTIRDGAFHGGTQVFLSDAVPVGANPNLPAPSPYLPDETYYNPSTYQIVSKGPDGITFETGQTVNVSGVGTVTNNVNYQGTAEDDITNFSY